LVSHLSTRGNNSIDVEVKHLELLRKLHRAQSGRECARVGIHVGAARGHSKTSQRDGPQAIQGNLSDHCHLQQVKRQRRYHVSDNIGGSACGSNLSDRDEVEDN